MTLAEARHHAKMLAAFVAERPEIDANENFELQCCQNKLAKMFSSNLAMQQQSQITSFFSQRQCCLANSKCKTSAILTTFKPFSRYNHISLLGSHCVWLYSVKPQLAISTQFPVTKPVVTSRCDCTSKALDNHLTAIFDI